MLAFSGAFCALASAFHSGVSYLFIVCFPVLCDCCVVVEYNAEGVPSFKSPMITGDAADVLCMHTVLRVLLCYRKVLPCYRECVTESLNNSSGFCISVYRFENRVYRVCDWLLAAIPPFTLATGLLASIIARARVCARAFTRVCVRVCACVCASRTTPKNQGGFRLMTGGARARELFTVVAPQICVRPN